MNGDSLESVLSGLDGGRTVTDRADTDAGSVLVVSCSMTRSGHDPSLWPADGVETVSAVSTLGNQVWERRDGQRVVTPDVARLAERPAFGAVLVVGHTACEVVADAFERYVAAGTRASAGIEARLEPLVSVVEEAVEAGFVDASTPPRRARYRLVEYNVVRGVAFLARRLPASVTVAGYVHDEDGAYSCFPGRHYLVTVDGETDRETLRSRLPDGEAVPVANLLY